MSRRISYAHLPKVDVPADRPRCVSCGTPLRPTFWLKYNTLEDGTKDYQSGPIAREFHRWSGHPWSNPMFCKQSCVMRFALAAYRYGLRIKPRVNQTTTETTESC